MEFTKNGIFDRRPCSPCNGMGGRGKTTRQILAWVHKLDPELPAGECIRLECWVCTNCGNAPNMSSSDQESLLAIELSSPRRLEIIGRQANANA